MNNKSLKITLNIFLFFLIAGFGIYMIHSVLSDERATLPDNDYQANSSISPYKKVNSFEAASNIISFDISEHAIYAVQSNQVSVYDISGTHRYDFEIKTNVRDIAVESGTLYLLYPTGIDVYTLDGEKTGEWEACSERSDYCAFTLTSAYIFVTDAANKHICQYNKEGGFVRFINSPQGFIIPSYSFDIINVNDTLYCSNSGRHCIESYSTDGVFIASFGIAGTQAGAFAGCCNPVYLAQSAHGHILTSEKGNPRISCYGKEGTFRAVLFDAKALGGGTAACEIHVSEEDIYIANKKTISVFRFDPNISEQSCADCGARCHLII